MSDTTRVLENLRYTKDHEWIDPTTGRVGISDHAQHALGDVVFLEFRIEVGEQVSAKQALGTVESVKTVSDIYSPVAGRVTARNQNVLDKPEVVNQDPYGDGWMFCLDIAEKSALQSLMDATAYKAFVGG